MKNKILTLLDELKFKGMSQTLDKHLAQAQKNGSSIQEILYQLLVEESRFRQERSLKYRIKNAKLPFDWTLNTFPFEQKPEINKTQIMTLGGLDFLQHGENIVFIGKTGTGKTGLATGILRQALLNGYRGRFYYVQDLLDELYASLADRNTPKLFRYLCNLDILLLDELGYLTLKPEQMNAFFKLLTERYDANKSTIITTNLDYPKWYDLLRPKDMVDALIDRLKHRCITINITGSSLRINNTND